MLTVQEKKAVVASLKKFAFYFEGVKEAKGNTLPFGTSDLENLWKATKLIK